jgi:hypothetical protein
MHEEACDRCGAGPCDTASILPELLDSIPGVALSGAALALRIEHGIRHAFPEWLFGFPYSENLPMGLRAKSIG